MAATEIPDFSSAWVSTKRSILSLLPPIHPPPWMTMTMGVGVFDGAFQKSRKLRWFSPYRTSVRVGLGTDSEYPLSFSAAWGRFARARKNVMQNITFDSSMNL